MFVSQDHASSTENINFCSTYQRKKIETVANRRDHNNIGCSHQRHPLLEPHFGLAAFLELHRSRPCLIYFGHHRQNFRPRFYVVLSSFKRRDAYLHQHNLSYPFWA
jgi:hypothetical protein